MGGEAAVEGPAPALLRWGARVMAVDLPQPVIWERLLGAARAGAGTRSALTLAAGLGFVARGGRRSWALSFVKLIDCPVTCQ